MSTWRVSSIRDYAVHLEVHRCLALDPGSPSPADIDEDDDDDIYYTSPPSHTTTNNHIKNVLGENLYASLQSYWSKEPEPDIEISVPENEVKEDIHSCEVVSHFAFSAETLMILLFIFLTICCLSTLCIYLCIIGKRYLIKRKSHSTSNTGELPGGSNVSTDSELVSEDTLIAEETTVSKSKTHASGKSFSPLTCGIPLVYQSRIFSGTQCEFEVADFLNHTTEKLFAKLDKLLLQQAPETTNQCSSHVTAAIATPRFARRALTRRQRSGSSPSLPQLDSTSGQQDEKSVAWKYFKTFCEQIEWKEPILKKVDDTKYDRKVQRLLHYYQRVCPMISDHWSTSTMIVNYALMIIQTNLEQIWCSYGYKFLRFSSTGSGQLGCKVGKPNQFDIHMVLQPPVGLQYVVEDTSEESIPPGQMLIVAQLPEDTSIPVREVVSQVKVNGHYRICLSSQKFARSAEELIETCLQTLYTKSRSLMDRLPLQIRRAPTANLILSIDTKALVGLNIPDIKLNVVPALLLPMNGWYQSNIVYATRSLKEEEVTKYRPGNMGAVNPDYLWHANLGDLNRSYTHNMNLKMLHAGVSSCHTVCLMILKALLTRGNKNSLLDRGVFASLHISTVLNFLLLESSPHQWHMDQLSNRFSDVVHFLRAAFSNHRLPNFFINNPCLAEKMPFVKNNQFLQRRRQQNLLADMRPEGFEKCLEYLEDCLRESGLQECVSEEYSADMWEYEFFVY